MVNDEKSWREKLADYIDELCAIDSSGEIDRKPMSWWRVNKGNGHGNGSGKEGIVADPK